MQQFDLFLSRHRDLYQFFVNKKIISSDLPILEHVDNLDLIKNKRIIGIIPSKLAILAHSISQIELNIPKEFKGKDLTPEQLEEFSGELQTFKVEEIKTRTDFSEAILLSNAATFVQYVVRLGLIKRGSEQHKSALNREKITREDIAGKIVLGHYSYDMLQWAKDISAFKLYYDFDHRGLVHDFDLMSHFDNGLFTFTVKRIA